ncbi:MAG: 4Fe-4S dicluster domain-containing protein [Nitrospinae bacterium]|nr:4Fe-4S dicluster domain-containing protein [Nitrospinota bacterium]
MKNQKTIIYIANRDEFHSYLLSQPYNIYAVTEKEGRYVFADVNEINDPGDKYTPTLLPPKKYLYPDEWILFRFKRGREEIFEIEDKEKRILFGVRPCDINAINLMDKIFSDGYNDNYYAKRRKDTILIGIDCFSPCDDHSFCYSVGHLDVKEGYDLLLKDIGTAYFVSIGSKRGRRLMTKFTKVRETTPHDIEQIREIEKKKEGMFINKFKTKVDNLPLLFRSSISSPIWEELGERDLGCGACNIDCPTCYCFDIQDKLELNIEDGRRVRDWDGCMLRDFTLVGSGEIFRASKADRLRHRFNRKFHYLMNVYKKSHCVGCGRCARDCLARISPVEVVNSLMV